MERIDKIQLSKLVSTGAVTSAWATRRKGAYNIIIDTPKKSFILKTQRSDERLFKTLDSVKSFFDSVQIKSFSVLG